MKNGDTEWLQGGFNFHISQTLILLFLQKTFSDFIVSQSYAKTRDECNKCKDNILPLGKLKQLQDPLHRSTHVSNLECYLRTEKN